MQKIWKDIPNEPSFTVSNYGEVKRFGDEFNCFVRDGYRIISFIKKQGNKRYTQQYRVAKLVLTLFGEDINRKIRHIDGNTLNDRIDNLEWVKRISSKEKTERAKKAKQNMKKEDPAKYHSFNMADNAFNRIKYSKNRKPSYNGKEFGFKDRKHLREYIYTQYKSDILELIKNNKYPTIDRIDSTKGYVEGNIRVISYNKNTQLGLDIIRVPVEVVYINGEIDNFESISRCDEVLFGSKQSGKTSKIIKDKTKAKLYNTNIYEIRKIQ